MTLLRSGVNVPTYFHLLGHYENSMTSGLAYALSASPRLLHLVVNAICRLSLSTADPTVIQIQTARRGKGITDIEIAIGDQFFCVIEAKNGAWLPEREQLECYAPVVHDQHAANRFLVTVSHATTEMSQVRIPSQEIDGIPMRHLPWRTVLRLVQHAATQETNRNKWLLRQFAAYLQDLLGMEPKFSNEVYVVSLAQGNPHGWDLSWIDIVEQRSRYFYPIGKSGWPDPPNYMGFRYHGRLQSIRWVKSHAVFTNPSSIFPEAPDEEWEDPQYCLTLDTPIIPPHEVRAGPRVRMSNRVKCEIDTLLTSKTISEALTKTEKRRKKIR